MITNAPRSLHRYGTADLYNALEYDATECTPVVSSIPGKSAIECTLQAGVGNKLMFSTKVSCVLVYVCSVREAT